MRNTKEYPITRDEIVICLRDLSLELTNDRPMELIGDMRPLLLQKAIDIIQTGTFDPT